MNSNGKLVKGVKCSVVVNRKIAEKYKYDKLEKLYEDDENIDEIV